MYCRDLAFFFYLFNFYFFAISFFRCTFVEKIRMKIYTLLLSLLLLLPTDVALAQGKGKYKKIGDFIESTSYNDSLRNTSRRLQYSPVGEGFECVDGNNRYTRALYGGHSAYRLETSDRPVFVSFVDGKHCKNISFRLETRQGEIALDTLHCLSRYEAGKRVYKAYICAGKEMTITALARYDLDGAIWKIELGEARAMAKSLTVRLCDIRNPKLHRNGDMGVEKPGSLEASDDPQKQKLYAAKINGDCIYVTIVDQEISFLDIKEGEKIFNKAEEARQHVAGRLKFSTPDPYFNTLGGTLAIAADAIWNGQVWLHGAVGWRMPLSGWRAAYVGDVLGWHDRARCHFDAYAKSQVTDIENTIPHPAQDSAKNLARAEKRWGTPMYSNGYICRNPERNNQMHHYDMNLCYIDELLWHLNWTGDIDYAKTMWQTIKSHLIWEKRNFDPDDDGLYDAYCCIWASDGVYYNSGAVTYSSAYNYRANKMAAMIAEKIGEDPTPYRREAEKILKAINEKLWIADEGHWAEYQDFMGRRLLHKSPMLPTIYHAIDSEIATPEQAYRAMTYIDTAFVHIPVGGEGLADDGYAVIPTSNWMPYVWSINNVALAELSHTALAYFQAGKSEKGYRLLKSALLDAMYLGNSPGNFAQLSFYDAARGECYRDFGDPIGITARALIQGVYGIVPDAMNGRLLLRPGFPSEWNEAKIASPDIDYSFKREGRHDEYKISQKFARPLEISLRVKALTDNIKEIRVNGKLASWTTADSGDSNPDIVVSTPSEQNLKIEIAWAGNAINRKVEDFKKKTPTGRIDFDDIYTAKCKAVNIDQYLNSNVSDIFQNKYLSPRSPYTTLQLPVQGIGEWCHPELNADIDDSGLRALVNNDEFTTSIGVPFRIKKAGNNIAYTSLWDNYPDSINIPLRGRASHAYLLMAGSTNQMQSRIANGEVRIVYADGTSETLPLVNPDNWCPIEQDYFVDGKAFYTSEPRPYRLHFKTGIVSRDLGNVLNIQGVYGRYIECGAGIMLDIPLDNNKKLKQLTLSTLANDVVIGLMGITLQR